MFSEEDMKKKIGSQEKEAGPKQVVGRGKQEANGTVQSIRKSKDS